ncbi:hypothetical protein [Flavobacterium sp. SORGH_AS_0622]|uniref:hypothetical protein n=1 Tax=Flavobacterium sp. SORGH_AS_0622 TaxID=3041772 RepID=UPI002786437F|nr:hypothetical protein [Flavobacterium sp. SORGH_AS_0622]MDQ1164601.1 hypothetical protein [Flavobacterium sp. SORGH_AS_0622]
MNLNNRLSDLFLNDAADYLNRYQNLKESASHTGLRSKLLVDLLFALECSLKSLIFLESNLDSKTTYKEIKSIGHSIDKLRERLSENSRMEFTKLVNIDLSIYKVFNRYMLESELVFREESGVLGRKYYDSIADPAWMESLFQQINLFKEYVSSRGGTVFEIFNIADVDIEVEQMKHLMLKEIISK